VGKASFRRPTLLPDVGYYYNYCCCIFEGTPQRECVCVVERERGRGRHNWCTLWIFPNATAQSDANGKSQEHFKRGLLSTCLIEVYHPLLWPFIIIILSSLFETILTPHLCIPKEHHPMSLRRNLLEIVFIPSFLRLHHRYYPFSSDPPPSASSSSSHLQSTSYTPPDPPSTSPQ
jgi:hypothetical protein